MVRQTFSKFGKVIKTILYEKPVSGAWGFYRFVLTWSRDENLTFFQILEIRPLRGLFLVARTISVSKSGNEQTQSGNEHIHTWAF